MWSGWVDAIAGAVNNRRVTNKTNRHNIEMRRMMQEQFDAQMDESVQRRVKDAQQAGIHPLFAMGGNVGASPTVSGTTHPLPTGGSVGNVAGLVAAAMEASIGERKSQTKLNEADAQLKDANRKSIENMFGPMGRDKLGAQNAPLGTPEFAETGKPGIVETQSSLVTSHKPGDPSTEAGMKVPYVEFRRKDGSVGTAFGADVPGAEEINMVWIPLQNWWHTSKQARNKLREKLGITSSEIARMQRDPAYTKKIIGDSPTFKQRLKKLLRDLGGRYHLRPPPRY